MHRSRRCAIVASCASLAAIAGCGDILGFADFTAATDGGSGKEATTTMDHVAPVSDARPMDATDAHARPDGGARTDARVMDGAAPDSPGVADTGAVLAPRPISPLSTSRVSSRTPTLRWVNPDGVTSATVDICSDRSCGQGQVISSTTVQGTSSYRPTTELPVGVVYWRVRPSASSTVTSPTWEFFVGLQDALVDSSWGSTLDVNGDGFADAVIGAYNAPGRAYVYQGGSQGLPTLPTATLTSPAGLNGSFGYNVAGAGDVNGDGYADILVDACECNGGDAGVGPGLVYVYLGSAAGVIASYQTVLMGPSDANGSFGENALSTAGDVNGDGYADVIVGAFDVTNGAGAAYVYLGGPSGLASTPTTVLSGPDGMNAGFGGSVAGLGDVNQDGHGDVVVSANGTSVGDAGEVGRVHIYLGNASGVDTTPSLSVTGPGGAGGYFGFPIAAVGDVNGDGYPDLGVGASGESNSTGSVYIYLGGPGMLAGAADGGVPAPATKLVGPGGPGENFGESLTGAGDVTGDGYSDVLVGAFGYSGNTGQAYFYTGSVNGLVSALPATTLVNPGATHVFYGSAVSSAGDVNGDGYADLLVGAYGAADYEGYAYVYAGGAGGLVDPGDASTVPPLMTLMGPDGAGGVFACAVFGAYN